MNKDKEFKKIFYKGRHKTFPIYGFRNMEEYVTELRVAEEERFQRQRQNIDYAFVIKK